MDYIVKFILSFLSTYVLTFILYQLFFIIPAKKRKRGKKKELLEIRYLIFKYKLDIDKVDYKQLLQIVALVSSFDIALIVSVEMFLVNWLAQILIVFILVIPVFMLSYNLVFKFYKKKGMIKDEF